MVIWRIGNLAFWKEAGLKHAFTKGTNIPVQPETPPKFSSNHRVANPGA